MNTHYLRGNLFENMVVADFIKNDFNKGIIEPRFLFGETVPAMKWT